MFYKWKAPQRVAFLGLFGSRARTPAALRREVWKPLLDRVWVCARNKKVFAPQAPRQTRREFLALPLVFPAPRALRGPTTTVVRPPRPNPGRVRGWRNDTQTGMPTELAQFAFKDSMIHLFCNSHYVSQLAAFFIDARAKRSTVKSCFLVCLWFIFFVFFGSCGVVCRDFLT